MRFDAPDGYHSVSVFLMLESIEQEIEFVRKVFDARISGEVRGPNGSLRYAEARIGNSLIMMDKARTGHPATRSMLHVWTDDVKGLHARALEAGATSIEEPTDQTYGNREAGIQDRQGNTWWIAQRIEKLSNQEVERRVAEQRRRRM
jgi:PhnB protein